MAPFPPGIDLQEIMATSRDQKELLWAWQGWRDAVGRQLRMTFERYVQLSNKAAKLNGEAPTTPPPRPAQSAQMAQGAGLSGKGKADSAGDKGNSRTWRWGP